VVAVLGWHTPLGDGLADEAGRVAELEHTPCASHPEHAGYPYVLVMVRAERSMHDVSVKERVAGYDLPTVRARPPGAAHPSQSIRRGPSEPGEIPARRARPLSMRRAGQIRSASRAVLDCIAVIHSHGVGAAARPARAPRPRCTGTPDRAPAPQCTET
jgi:hypothetical protein